MALEPPSLPFPIAARCPSLNMTLYGVRSVGLTVSNPRQVYSKGARDGLWWLSHIHSCILVSCSEEVSRSFIVYNQSCPCNGSYPFSG